MSGDYDLRDWKDSVLLKEAAEHLSTKPEYEPMNPAAKVALIEFGHAFRYKLRKAKDRLEAGDQNAIQDFCNDYGFDITVTDNCRFGIDLHGYKFVIILDIKIGDGVLWSEQILFSEGRQP